jgi:transposase
VPFRKKDTLHIRELLRHLRRDQSERQIRHDTGLARDTIRRYKKWAQEHALLEGDEFPSAEQLQSLLDSTLPPLLPPQNLSSVEPYAQIVTDLRNQKVEMAALYNRLKERGYQGSYSAVWRYVRRTEAPVEPEVTLRVETPPGYEAQVDFGEVGLFRDPDTGQMRKTYAFVITLAFSRHCYAELVFDQKAMTWLAAHNRAFAYFGAVPHRIVIDNLKAGIQKAVFENPEVNRSYAELAEHYGFLIAPCRPRTPEHKGKVESGVHFVQRNFIAGREECDVTQGNRDLLAWCREVAERKHGTTKKKPREQFDSFERAALLSLPQKPYDLAVYKKVKLHRDCHVTFDNAYYSAPHRLIGDTFWVRGGLSEVRILTEDHHCVATHPRAKEAGERRTNLDHLPPERAALLPRTPDALREEAEQVGPDTRSVVNDILSHPTLDKTSSAARLLALSKKHTPERLEKACARALRFSDPCYTTVRDILAKGLEAETPPLPQAPIATTFARTARELFGQFKGALSWM